MIKDFIKFLQDQKKEPIIEIKGKNYNVLLNNEITPIKENYKVPIKTNTLTSIIDYISTNPDDLDIKELFIHIYDHSTVTLLSRIKGDFSERTEHIIANYDEPCKELNEFIGQERFIIKLATLFVPSDERDKIIKMISSVSENNIRTTEDNGISQTVTTKAGVSMLNEQKLPSVVSLWAFRTFTEVTQPKSLFLLRAKKGHESLSYALFEADGGEWKNTAISIIKEWLIDALEKKGLSIPVLS